MHVLNLLCKLAAVGGWANEFTSDRLRYIQPDDSFWNPAKFVQYSSSSSSGDAGQWPVAIVTRCAMLHSSVNSSAVQLADDRLTHDSRPGLRVYTTYVVQAYNIRWMHSQVTTYSSSWHFASNACSPNFLHLLQKIKATESSGKRIV